MTSHCFLLPIGRTLPKQENFGENEGGSPSQKQENFGEYEGAAPSTLRPKTRILAENEGALGAPSTLRSKTKILAENEGEMCW